MKISTFSVVARDPETGMLAVAGGTNWFNYGRWVPHAEAGFGALATQAETNMWYAPNGLENLRNGMSASDTLSDLVKRNEDTDGVYQLLIIDNLGNTVCHTGSNNPDFAGHVLEENLGVAGNTLVSKATLDAVADYYRNSSEDFGLRIIKALQAGQKAGGDIRGMKSAAMKVVTGKATGEFWSDTVYDLRVDESPDPLKELQRLYTIAEAYNRIGDAEEASTPVAALESYKKALELDPDNQEIKFWIAWNCKQLGQQGEADKILASLPENWHEFLRRLEK